ncbi:tyrosine-type recombinase/integrase [Gammaproteobacteria bacterium]|nr:tyrosine-type recombinase/integrase [Gammaproteobacteria bacterium]
MKSTGRHREKILTAAAVRSITKPGLHADGGGLYLKVDRSGAKRWMQRIVIKGKRCDLGLGSTSLVTLATARQAALENRKTARDNGDPLADKRQATSILTFEAAAHKVHALHLPTWSNVKQGRQWISSLAQYAFPYIGTKKMDAITSADVLTVLSPIWIEKAETAARVRQRISTVMKWAIGKGWRSDNPAADIQAALPKRKKRVTHHKSLPYQDVAHAIAEIKTSDASISVKLALEMLVLTALRSGEVRNAKWDEVDFDAAVWEIPAERMKQRKPHRVPLSQRGIKILREAEQLRDQSDYIFPGTVPGKPLSDNTLSKLLRELGIECVPHGFRSSFRMWAGEQTNIPREVCEFALAHVVGDAAERAYQRSDLFEKRRKLMAAWARYLEVKKTDVVPIRDAKQ